MELLFESELAKRTTFHSVDNKAKSHPSDFEKVEEEAKAATSYGSLEGKIHKEVEKELKDKLADLKSKLRATKNVRIVSGTGSAVNDKRALRRAHLRKQISELEAYLSSLTDPAGLPSCTGNEGATRRRC